DDDAHRFSKQPSAQLPTGRAQLRCVLDSVSIFSWHDLRISNKFVNRKKSPRGMQNVRTVYPSRVNKTNRRDLRPIQHACPEAAVQCRAVANRRGGTAATRRRRSRTSLAQVGPHSVVGE